jgi:hypothetical protein
VDDLQIWRIVFDAAVHSMDFGSGFLDDEEVAALRRAAVILGADPDSATPDKFICKYRGHHQAEPFLDHPMLTSPDGLPLNAYRRRETYPEHARPFLRGVAGLHPPSDDLLGKLDCPVIGMHCTVCHRFWDAFADTGIDTGDTMDGGSTGQDSGAQRCPGR